MKYINSDQFVGSLTTGRPAQLYDRSNPDWAPTQKMGQNKLLINVDASALSRHERVGERGKKRKLADEAEALRRVEEFARGEEEAAEKIRLAQR